MKKPAHEPRAVTSRTRDDRDLRARAAIVLCALVTFARAVPYPLQRSWDDGRFILDNAEVAHISWANFVALAGQVRFEAFHPLHLLSYWLDVPWFGAEPWALHGVSLALWSLALVLVYECMRVLELSPLMAALATLACGLHPVQVEAVSWATGRKDVLALLFSSACLLSHLRSSHGSDRYAWCARGFFVAAALSKTAALPLPLWPATLDAVVRGVPARKALARQAPSLACALGLAFVVIHVWQSNEMVRATNASVGLAPVRMLNTLHHQLGTLLWPARVSPMYSTHEVGQLALAHLLLPLLLATATVFAGRKRKPRVLAGILGFALMYLPVSNLVPMYFPFQDRYASILALPLALALGASVDTYVRARARSWPQVLLGMAVLVLAVRTIQYQGEWSSETRLWGHAAHTQPDADYAWLKLGETRRDAGDLEGAISAYRSLVRLRPTLRLAHAALFEAVARRDERIHGLAPSRARSLAQRYYEGADHADAMRQLARELLANGYLRTVELTLDRALALDSDACFCLPMRYSMYPIAAKNATPSSL